MEVKKTLLRRHLETLYRTFDRAFLSSDPVEYVHRFSDPRDIEVSGLICASLAYGRVESIKRAIEKVMEVMDWKPYGFVMRFLPQRDRRLFSGFVYRFNRGEDISCLIYYMKQMIEDAGSIGRFFMKGFSHKDRNIKNALSIFSRNALGLDSSPLYGSERLPEDAGVRFFFPSPEDGSPCKRLNLFLRWMVRRGDELDFGIWDYIPPSMLVIPLDTHVARISRYIGLTRRSTSDWKMAEEITESLRELDPSDPVKYDFSISRLGILERCPRKKDGIKCNNCTLKAICIL